MVVDFFYIGTLMPFPYNFIPEGWMACNGQTLQIAENATLFSLIANTYGGDGIRTFKLPRLNSTSEEQSLVAVMGMGEGPGLTRRYLGQRVGSPTEYLETNQMPAHSHGFQLTSGASGTTNTPTAGATLLDSRQPTYVAPYSEPETTLASTSITNVGQFAPHDNMQPYMQLYWCICYDGIYPPRG